MEEQAVASAADDLSQCFGLSARILTSKRLVRHAVAAEVDHCGLEPSQLTKKVQRLHRPPGHQLELVAVATALQLGVNSAGLLAKRLLVGAKRIGCQEQDR